MNEQLEFDDNGMTRRRFFQAGAAGILVASVPLPAGMPMVQEVSKLYNVKATGPVHQYNLHIPWDWTTAVYCSKRPEIPYPHDCFEGFRSVAFKPDGTEMYVIEN